MEVPEVSRHVNSTLFILFIFNNLFIFSGRDVTGICVISILFIGNTKIAQFFYILSCIVSYFDLIHLWQARILLLSIKKPYIFKKIETLKET